MWIYYILIFLILAVLTVVIHDITCFRTVTYEIEDPDLKQLGTVALLTDLHDHAFGAHNYKLIRELLRENPDCIFLAGDLLNATSYSKNEHALEFLRELEEAGHANWNGHIYLSFGNHEGKIKKGLGGRKNAKEKLDLFLAETKIHVLDNRQEAFGENIMIAGLSLPQSVYKRGDKAKLSEGGIKEILGFEKEKKTVLLAHNPEYFEEYTKWGADLILSGHVHGGIANLPLVGGVISPRLRPFPKFDGGLFESGDSKMILSRGLSWHTLPVRFLNPGELVIIKFK